MRQALCLFLLLGLQGCMNYDDNDWTMQPGEATDSIAVEEGPGKHVCVRDPDSGERSCVPKLADES